MGNIAEEALASLKGFLDKRETSAKRFADNFANSIDVGDKQLFQSKEQVVDAILNPPDPFGGSLKIAGEAANIASRIPGIVKKASRLSEITGGFKSSVDDVVNEVLSFVSKSAAKSGELDIELAKKAARQLSGESNLSKNLTKLVEDRVVGVLEETNIKTIVEKIRKGTPKLTKTANRMNIKKSLREEAKTALLLDEKQVTDLLEKQPFFSKLATDAGDGIKKIMLNQKLPPIDIANIPLPPGAKLSNAILSAKDKAGKLLSLAGDNKLKTLGATVGGAIGGKILIDQLDPTSSVTASDVVPVETVEKIVKPVKKTQAELTADKLNGIIDKIISLSGRINGK